jgi:superfamily I DNA and/or RNA helicase
LRNIDFPVVFLDEASMATEPASLIPLMKGVSDGLLRETSVYESPARLTQSQHVVLIGDHKQLPPVIRSREAQIRGLNISLFERLTEEGGMS